MHNQPIKLRPIWSWPIFFYLACVALSYTLHPVGLWAFGSNTGGAHYYVQIAMAFSAFLILSSVVPKERHRQFILSACLLGNPIGAGLGGSFGIADAISLARAYADRGAQSDG